MQDHNFASHDGSKTYYYIFIKGDEPIGQVESRFFRFGTALEATALYQFLQTDRPELSFSLGVHRNFTRRADIIERIDGINVLSDSVALTSPWKDEPTVRAAVDSISKRLEVAWRTDRELVGASILIPNEERSSSYLPPYFEGKALCPDVPGNPRTSIREVFVQGLGWMSLDGLQSVAKHPGHGNPAIPAVSQYLVAYQVDNGFKGTATISPADFETMEKRYLAQLEKDGLQKEGDGRGDLDALKREAKTRAQSQLRPTNPASRAYDHAL